MNDMNRRRTTKLLLIPVAAADPLSEAFGQPVNARV